MKVMKPGELSGRLCAGEAVEVLDIREEKEYSGWNIPGSRNLPAYTALALADSKAFAEAAESLPKDRPIVAVCRGGRISERAVQVLGWLGYDAINLEGGMRGWGAVWTEAEIALGNANHARCIQIRRNGKGCLSYLFGSDGEAAVVDPSVEIRAYLDAADRLGLKITKVFETHVHADHLSRARELCKATGATFFVPPNDRVTYDYMPIRDGEKTSVGGVTVEAIATPGHTGESTCYLLDGSVMLSGDTLFTSNVGRPDLEKGDDGADVGARMLYKSLRDKLLGKGDGIGVYPAHHGCAIGFDGIPIGAKMSEIRATLDLAKEDEDAFAARIVGSLQAKPPNHHAIIAVNEGKAELIGNNPLEIEAGPNRCAAG